MYFCSRVLWCVALLWSAVYCTIRYHMVTVSYGYHTLPYGHLANIIVLYTLLIYICTHTHTHTPLAWVVLCHYVQDTGMLVRTGSILAIPNLKRPQPHLFTLPGSWFSYPPFWRGRGRRLTAGLVRLKPNGHWYAPSTRRHLQTVPMTSFAGGGELL